MTDIAGAMILVFVLFVFIFVIKEMVVYIRELQKQVRFLTKAMMARDLSELTDNEAVNNVDTTEEKLSDWMPTDLMEDDEFLNKIDLQKTED